LLDKSKSVKTVLMRLFTPSGNTSIEGVDTVNACYGGTNALFNAINWVESSAWDGRDAIVVAGDIALYSKGNARPTGGAGCVAMLVGPDAPLVLEPGKRGTYMTHAYDFYKPDFTSEYPLVDGYFSIRCYTEAVDACYKAYNKRDATLAGLSRKKENGATTGNGVANGNGSGHATPHASIDRFDYMLFHAPTCKLVSKSYARLLYNDFLASPDSEQFTTVPQDLRELDYEHSLSDRNIEKAFIGLSKKRFEERVKPSLLAPTQCGNMYTASVYSGLVSLLSNVDSDTLQGKRVALFSYGSGLASSLFSLTVKGSTKELAEKVDLKERLDARRVVEPQLYNDASSSTPLALHLFSPFTNVLTDV
jgi:hydroxymethylglutaryl-CoA synthase